MNALRAGVDDSDLPSVPRALWRAMQLAYQSEKGLLLFAFALNVASWIPGALAALWLGLLANGVTEDRPGLVRLAAAGIALAAVGGWLLRTFGNRVYNLFRDRATIEIEAHVARLQSTAASIEHHERPEYLNRLQLLRDHVFLLNHLYGSFMNALGSVGQVAITVALLMSVHWSLFLLAVLTIPMMVIATKRAGAERRAEEQAAPHARLARHLFDLCTLPGPAKELRVSGNTAMVVSRRRREWDAWYEAVSSSHLGSAIAFAAAWSLFGLGYVGAVTFVASGLDASAGDVLLVLAAGANLSRFLTQTAGEAAFLRWTLDAAQRLTWLEDYAATVATEPDQPVPERLREGIRFERVSFRYPGTDAEVLQDVDLTLPAGSVVALVGENGAGKTTLVKLLCRFYDPTSGRVTVDGVDLARIPAAGWRSRLAGAFQDFFKFEYVARRSIGVGEPPRMDDVARVAAAIDRGGAVDVIERLPAGVETQLGPTWTDGVELSIGQWQKLALSRGFMREQPLVCVLDEPTASLDAETEHALFERFAAESRAASGAGTITVLVSHRFSTVRMADLIVVLDGSRVAEMGTHDELMARGGPYAELYEIQASAYR
ncbi:MAG TPA: ABC transporter ATP-binding protein [Acidimicrobiales bacterium]|nr:ABC transporter ATP-binding protein [Acidimicrobiales bacterium]